MGSASELVVVILAVVVVVVVVAVVAVVVLVRGGDRRRINDRRLGIGVGRKREQLQHQQRNTLMMVDFSSSRSAGIRRNPSYRQIASGARASRSRRRTPLCKASSGADLKARWQ